MNVFSFVFFFNWIALFKILFLNILAWREVWLKNCCVCAEGSAERLMDKKKLGLIVLCWAH